MTTVLKSDISQAFGQALIDDIFLQKSRYYYTLGRSYQWSDESSPDEVVSSEKYQKDVRRDILYVKQISGTSVSFVIDRHNYTKNQIYVKYDDAVSMENKKFYVLNSDNNVYKCLDNNIGGMSTIEPYGTSPTPLTLADGYVWQYIYTVPPSLKTKFLTEEFMPVFNAVTERYYSRGSVASIKINSGGSGYVQETTQLLVTGDGYLEDNPAKINSFNIATNGSGYTSVPTVETSDQFGNYTSFSSGMNLIEGQRFRVSDSAGVRFYQATSAGQTGSSAPTHYYSSVLNGSTILKHVGTKPKITATIDATSVGSVVVTDAGFGYLSIPNVAKSSPGSGCVLSSVVSGESIQSITVQSGGTGYSNNVIVIDSPYPSSVLYTTTTAVALGQILYASVSGKTYFYRVDTAGTTGATTPTHTTGTALNGTAMLTVVARQATAEAVLGIVSSITQYYDIESIKINSGGTGYVQGSTSVVFTGGNPTSPAIANAVVSGGKITSINITFPGYGYQSAPSVSISGVGTGANLSPVMQCGYGYSLAPTLVFSAPNNIIGAEPFVFSNIVKTEAKLEPIVSSGVIIGVRVIDGGVGYTQANIEVVGAGTGASMTVIFASSELNTIQAESELLATAGTISSVTVTNQGNNITSLSIVLDGDGTGVVLTPVIDNGRLVDIRVTNRGQNYSYLNITLVVNNDAGIPVARAIVAPSKGHGSNPIKELYTKSIALNVAVGDDISNGFQISNDFRQIGILKSPLAYNEQRLLESISASACMVVLCNTTATPLTKNAILTSNNLQYRVIDFTPTKILLSSVSKNQLVSGDILTLSLNNINYTIQVNSVEAPEFDKNSGDLLYIDNMIAFAPSENQTINVTTTISLT